MIATEKKAISTETRQGVVLSHENEKKKKYLEACL
jgi:hypothetical protein